MMALVLLVSQETIKNIIKKNQGQFFLYLSKISRWKYIDKRSYR